MSNNNNNKASAAKSAQQQSISNYTKPKAGQLQEIKKKHKEMNDKESSALDQQQQQWEKEYQSRGRILDLDDEEQMDNLIQNTAFTEKANQKQDSIEETVDKELENSPKSGDHSVLEVPSKTPTLLTQLAYIGTLLQEHAQCGLPLRIQTIDNITESEVSSMSSELKPTIANLTEKGAGVINVTKQCRCQEQWNNSLLVAVPKNTRVRLPAIAEEVEQEISDAGEEKEEGKVEAVEEQQLGSLAEVEAETNKIQLDQAGKNQLETK